MLAVVVAYLPVWHAGYIWDDDVMLTANPSIAGPLGFKEIWTQSITASAFDPLTRSTFWLEHQFWGFAPGPYHVVNVLLHGTCAILLWRVLLELEIPGAWLGAALWALHPVEVETVAWVAELKNTESGVFFLLAVLFYIRWIKRRPFPRSGRWLHRDYALALLFSALAMMCKASTIVLPAVFCLGAWWIERRWRWRYLADVAPSLGMGIAVTLLSMRGQEAHMAGVPGLELNPAWPERIVVSGDSVWFYLGKLVWPSGLATVYPRWNVDTGRWSSYLPALAVVFTLLLLWRARDSWGRPYFLAFAYFLVALLPVVGLAENTIFQYGYVFDHLQYLASVSLPVLAGAGVALGMARLPADQRWLPVAGVGAALLILAVATWQRASVYRTSIRLWTDAVSKNPGSWLAHYNLGDALQAGGRTVDGLREFEQALALKPPLPNTYLRIGERLAHAGRLNEAIACYRRPEAAGADRDIAMTDLGQALLQAGRPAEAIPCLESATKLSPEDDWNYINLGQALFDLGRFDEAITEYRKGLAMRPDVSISHYNLARALEAKNDPAGAAAEYQAALRLNPRDADIYYRLGGIRLRAGRFDEAIALYRAALALNPGSPKTHNNLGIVLARSGRPADAVAEFEQALALDPASAEAKRNLELAQAAAARQVAPKAK